MSATHGILYFYGSVKPLAFTAEGNKIHSNAGAFTQQAHALIKLIKLLTFVKFCDKLSLHEA